jgi:hypothetical protein
MEGVSQVVESLGQIPKEALFLAGGEASKT